VTRTKPSLTNRVVTGLFWTATGKAARSVLLLLVLSVMARLLTPAEFGVVSAALLVIGFSGIFAQLGLGPAIVQRAALEPRHLKTAFAASLHFGFILGAVVWLTAPLVADFFRIAMLTPVLRVLAVSFPLRGLAVVSESLMQRELQFRWLAARELASYAVGFGVVGPFLAFQGRGVWALVTAHLAFVTTNTVLLLIGRRPPVGLWPERQAFQELVHFGGGVTLARIANFFALQGDNLVVGRYLGPVALGFYGRAYQLMAAPSAALGEVLDLVLFPAMASVQGEVQRLALAYRKGVSLIALVVLPASVLLFGLAPEFVAVLLGPKWTDVIVPFQILAAGMLFRTSYKMSDSICRATGAVYPRAWRQGLYAALVIGGSLVGKRWGLEGVATGVLAALTVNFLAMAQLSLNVTQMSWGSLLRAHLPALRLGLACGLVLWGLVEPLRMWQVPSALRLVVASAGTLAAVLALAWVAPRVFVGPDGLWMLKRLWDFVPKRLTPSRPSAT
jgi:O-antigen/teichoic acid export membrane protein